MKWKILRQWGRVELFFHRISKYQAGPHHTQLTRCCRPSWQTAFECPGCLPQPYLQTWNHQANYRPHFLVLPIILDPVNLGNWVEVQYTRKSRLVSPVQRPAYICSWLPCWEFIVHLIAEMRECCDDEQVGGSYVGLASSYGGILWSWTLPLYRWHLTMVHAYQPCQD